MPTVNRFRNQICIVSAESKTAFLIAERIGQEGRKIVINSKNVWETKKAINNKEKELQWNAADIILKMNHNI
ncbi:unnamed protein product [Blepharisma stoltei]|uniref:Uncharacterized protein n=1 Tax=Blepharisma stoltei TaxID=1481888 RepID=A0AAU9IJJ8_9CILI|nr:unnamed protein product [Blepharisma stoltei]